MEAGDPAPGRRRRESPRDVRSRACAPRPPRRALEPAEAIGVGDLVDPAACSGSSRAGWRRRPRRSATITWCSIGADRARYAGHLVELAGRGSLPPTALSGVGMVSLRSLLGRRIVRILDSSRSLSTRAGRRAVAAALIAGIARDAARGAARRQRGEEGSQGGAPRRSKRRSPTPRRRPTTTGQSMARSSTLTGKPVPGATVFISLRLMDT